MPFIRYNSVCGASVDAEVSEELAKQYADIKRRQSLVNRKETRRHQSLDKSLENGWDIADNSVNVEDEVQCREIRIMLSKALRLLSEKQRTVLNLYIEHELSFREIGEMLGISKDTAKEHYYSAIKKLKKYLENTPSKWFSRGH